MLVRAKFYFCQQSRCSKFLEYCLLLARVIVALESLQLLLCEAKACDGGSISSLPYFLNWEQATIFLKPPPDFNKAAPWFRKQFTECPSLHFCKPLHCWIKMETIWWDTKPGGRGGYHEPKFFTQLSGHLTLDWPGELEFLNFRNLAIDLAWFEKTFYRSLPSAKYDFINSHFLLLFFFLLNAAKICDRWKLWGK